MTKTYLFTFGLQDKGIIDMHEVSVSYDEHTTVSEIITFIRGCCDMFYPDVTIKDIKGSTSLSYYLPINDDLSILVLVKEINHFSL